MFGKLARLQVERPHIPLVIVAAITIAAVLLALRLEVLTGFEQLLPGSYPSVQELDRVAARTAGVSTLYVILEGDDTGALRKCADALVPAFEEIGRPWVGTAESGVHEGRKFLRPRAGLFVPLDKLQKVHDQVAERYEFEVGKQTGASLGLDDEEPPEIDIEEVKKDLGIDDDKENRYPDGYYQAQDGRTVVVAIRSAVFGSDYAGGTETIARVRQALETTDPKSFHPSIRYGFAGDLFSATSEYRAINEDLTDVGYLGAALILGVVMLYYVRIRTLIAMTLTIGIGVAWTFGFTQLALGHLNMATGFLFTIVAGNGINTGIIYMARYLEARRGNFGVADSIRVAHRETWLPTATAAGAAAASYGSLLITEFRGFRDFGIIGGAGMILCWVATYLALPSILVMSERLAPLERKSSVGWLARVRAVTEGGVGYGRPFAAIVKRAPGTVVLAGMLLTLAGVALTVVFIRSDPMEYDLHKLRTDKSARLEEVRLDKLSREITGYVGGDGMAILVDRIEQVRPLKAALEARRDAAPAELKPFKAVHALTDLVPDDQSSKIPLLQSLKDKILRSHRRELIKQEDFARIAPYLPPDDLRPYALDDLPRDVAQAFTENDGTRGRVVYISPTSAKEVHDAHYVFRWADSYRRTELPDGSVVLGSGRAVIYADMWTAVLADVPPAVLVSFIATALVVVLAFRAGRAALAVLLSLLVGVSWMVGLLVVAKVKLNFLNFIALPITFGIGVDYAVNVVQRYVREGAGSAVKAIQQTGGAVVLCSLTTALGYLALVGSVNHAVRSLGTAAVLGEVTCLLAAVLVLPAALTWLDRSRPRGSASHISIHPPPLR